MANTVVSDRKEYSQNGNETGSTTMEKTAQS